ncbi:MAG: response regulator [Syntrophobacterales bacterium]|nr:response regulator [Syntrophobacterales bacterium]
MQPQETKYPQRTLKVLIVDDEVAYVDVLRRRMQKRNVIVETANSGSEAIRKLRESSFDIAIIDLKMEDMSGIEVLKIFKKMDPDMPVIMITGHGSEEAAQNGITCGAYDYLMKPCDFETLMEKINKAVLNKRG